MNKNLFFFIVKCREIIKEYIDNCGKNRRKQRNSKIKLNLQLLKAIPLNVTKWIIVYLICPPTNDTL